MDKYSDFDVLVVVTPADFKRLLRLYPLLVENIKSRKVFFVGTKEVGQLINNSNLDDNKVFWIDENSIISFSDVHKVLSEYMRGILGEQELPRGITGWYYQQFLKMHYASMCKDEYYMVWDGDTIPCRKIGMFQKESGKPYLDLKHECHKEYFDTIARLFPGFGKVIEQSFISEHMLIKTDIMRELINEIEKNDTIIGSSFWEKIIKVIPPTLIQNSAFSEFETYGTYVAMKYPSIYKLREWHSFRQGGSFFFVDTICERDFLWLAKDFDAISFEKGHTVRFDNANLFDNPYYQEKLTPKQMVQAAQLEYKEGYKEVWEDDGKTDVNVTKGTFNE